MSDGYILRFDTEHNTPAYVTPDEAKDTATYVEPGNQVVRMAAPDGRHTFVLAKDYEAALKTGYQWVPPTSDELKTQAEDKEIKKAVEESSGPIEGLKSFGNQALMGVPKMISEAGETDFERRKREAIEEAYPISRGIGGIFGFGTSLLYGGELGDIATHGLAEGAERLAPGIAERLGESTVGRAAIGAGKGAVQGATFGIAPAAAQAYVKDPEAGAESLLWNMGIGSVLGAGGSLVSDGAGWALKTAKGGLQKIAPEGTTNLINEFADDQAMRQVGVDPVKVGKTPAAASTRKNVLDLLQEENVNGETRDDAWAHGLETKKYGPQIGAIRDEIDAALPELNKPENLFKDGQSIKPYGIDPSELADAAKASMLDKFGTYYGQPGFENLTNRIDNIEQGIRNSDPGVGTIGFGKPTQEIIDRLRKAPEDASPFNRNAGMISLPDQASMHAQSFASDWRDKEILRTLQGMDGATAAEKFAGYQKAMNMFSATKTLQSNRLEAKKGLGQAIMGGSTLTGLALAGMGHIGLGGMALAYPVAKLFSQWIAPNIAERTVMPFGIKVLKRIASDSPSIFGSMMGKVAEDGAASKMAEIAPMLLNAAKKAPYRAIDPLKSMLGSSANGLSKDQQYKAVAAHITNAVANPESIATNLGGIQAMVADHPELASHLANKSLNAISYLNSQLPKDPTIGKPFQGNSQWKPTDQQVNEFKKKLAVVEDPFIAVHHMADGTLSNAERETLKTIYPKLYDMIAGETAKAAFSPTSNQIPHKTRAGMQKMAEVAPTSNLGPNIQQTYAAKASAGAPNGSAPAPKHTNELKGKGPSLQTSSQKRSYA